MTNKEAIESAMQYIKAARRSVQIAISTLEDAQEEALSVQAAQHYYLLSTLYLDLLERRMNVAEDS